MVAEGLGRIISGQDDFELAGLAAAGADPPALASVKAEVVDKSIYLQQNYHFGPLKILVYLKRYHDITISDAGVWNILKRLDMNRLPSSQRYKPHRKRWKRYEKPRPGNGVQIDDKFISPITGSRKQYYQFTAIDDCTRLRVLRIYDRLNQKSAIGSRLRPREAPISSRDDSGRQ